MTKATLVRVKLAPAQRLLPGKHSREHGTLTLGDRGSHTQRTKNETAKLFKLQEKAPGCIFYSVASHQTDATSHFNGVKTKKAVPVGC